jgi:hypothetical protein
MPRVKLAYSWRHNVFTFFVQGLLAFEYLGSIWESSFYQLLIAKIA